MPRQTCALSNKSLEPHFSGKIRALQSIVDKYGEHLSVGRGSLCKSTWKVLCSCLCQVHKIIKQTCLPTRHRINDLSPSSSKYVYIYRRGLAKMRKDYRIQFRGHAVHLCDTIKAQTIKYKDAFQDGWIHLLVFYFSFRRSHWITLLLCFKGVNVIKKQTKRRFIYSYCLRSHNLLRNISKSSVL